MATRHFACTRCGACCNRPPELELGEAAALADVFVLRLMMRIYSLPRSVTDYLSGLPRDEASAEFYESKRLLATFAAASWPIKAARDDAAVNYVQHLSLSVLPLDLGGACPALDGAVCGIYERRPLSCRSVPLHYSRPEAAAARDLDAFVATPGYRCAVGADAAVVIEAGRITDPGTTAARAEASERAVSDRRWKAALVKAMKARAYGLPSPREVEAQAPRGALTASMLGAWTVAAAAGLFEPDAVQALLTTQCERIERELARPGVTPDAIGTLTEMLREYRAARPG